MSNPVAPITPITPIPPIPAPAVTTVTWKPSGPCIIEGPVIIRNNEGEVMVPPPAKIPGQVKLCGCGLSKNRPFCDGSHNR